MSIQDNTKKEFNIELINFEKLLNNAEDVSKRFPKLVKIYTIKNAFGTLHFLFSRNARLIRQSYNLAKDGYYTEAFIIIRSVMEGALLTRYFAMYPKKLTEWHESQKQIYDEPNLTLRLKLRRKREERYGPNSIRKEIAAKNEKLYQNFCDIYAALSDYTHPSILKEGDFLRGTEYDYYIGIEPYYHKGLFIQWFRAASLTLSTNMRFIEIFYKNRVFEHLGKPFLFEIKAIAEQITSLMRCLPKDQ